MSQARDRVRDENSESIIRQANKDLRVARGILFLVGFVTIETVSPYSSISI